VSRRPDAGIVGLALLGGSLLVYLALPLAYLFVHIEWREIRAFLTDPRAVGAVEVSLVTSVTATAIMTALGVPLGYLLARVPFPGRRFVIGLVFVPMVLPPLVGGILLLLMYGPYGIVGVMSESFGIRLVNTLGGIVLAQVFVASPYVVIASLSAFAAVDIELEQAAATLGDYRWQIIRRVSLPLARPGIAAGITLAWVRTLGEFGATLVMAYHPNTLPVFLWVQLTSEGLRAALPLALMLMVIGAGTIAAVHLLGLVPGVAVGVAPETSWRKTGAPAMARREP
jgi:molybdate/tungstate transport system permease protein